MVRASSRNMPRTRWNVSSVAVFEVSVCRTSGCSGQLVRKLSAVSGRPASSAIASRFADHTA